jgi:hypothetical protein
MYMYVYTQAGVQPTILLPMEKVLSAVINCLRHERSKGQAENM